MKLERRKAQAVLVSNLQAQAGSQQVIDFLALLDSLREDAKELLVVCDPVDCARLQGEAQAFDKVHRLLARPSVNALQGKGDK